MIITLAGHVDHGKSSLVRALTGVDTDRLAEEKRRGLTIDLGFAYADFAGQRIGFVDVPGHHRFVHNMVAGVAAHQTALVVVAADDGVMPQTREHLTILELIGVRRAIVAVTKSDRVDDDRLTRALTEAHALLGESSIECVAMIATSTSTGRGLEELRQCIANLAAEPVMSSLDQEFRLAVDRAFNVRGAGLVVTGTVHSGAVHEGDELLVAPLGQQARARAIRVNDEVATRANAGDRCALNLTGLDAGAVGRGNWVVSPGALAPVTRLVAFVRVARDWTRTLNHWLPVHVYHATSHSEGHVALLDSPPLTPGTSALIELDLAEPLNAKHGDPIVIRDHGMDTTVGGGSVIDIAAVARHRRSPRRMATLRAQQTDDPAAALAALLAQAEVEIAAMRANWNLTAAAMDALFEPQRMVRIDSNGRTYFLTIERWQNWCADVTARVGGYHKAAPHSPGLKRDQLRQVTSVPAQWLDAVLAELMRGGQIKEAAGHFSLPGHRARLPVADERLLKRIERALTATDQPPSLGDLGKQLGVDLASLKTFVQRMAAEGLLVRVAENRVFMPAFVARMAAVAIVLGGTHPDGFSAKDFRDQTGIGRNLVIDLLEYFDRKSFTRRYGDLRRIVGDVGKL